MKPGDLFKVKCQLSEQGIRIHRYVLIPLRRGDGVGVYCGFVAVNLETGRHWTNPSDDMSKATIGLKPCRRGTL